MNEQDVRLCRLCLKPLAGYRARRKHTVYCSRQCAREHARQIYRECNDRTGLASSTVGAINELQVALDLMRRGFDVFRALSPSATCDLAVIRDGKLIRIEVRTGNRWTDGRRLKATPPKPGRADVWAVVHSKPLEIRYYPDLFLLHDATDVAAASA